MACRLKQSSPHLTRSEALREIGQVDANFVTQGDEKEHVKVREAIMAMIAANFSPS
jgi:hypothetical protein